jgi:hypothetical protein
MLLSVEQTISALVDALVRQYRTPDYGVEQVEAVLKFLAATQSKMPDYLKLPFHFLVLLFDAWPYPTTGKPFHSLGLSERKAQIELWEKSRFEFCRGLITFYRTLATFGLYSEICGHDSGVATQHE